MATKLVAHVDDRFFTRSKHGAIWGTIYFQVDRQFFPDERWTDMPVAFVRAWLETLTQIANRIKVEDSVPFFDGPVEVRISTSDGTLANLTFVHKGKVTVSATEEIKRLLENAVATADLLLRSCRQKGWANADSEPLAALTRRHSRSLPN